MTWFRFYSEALDDPKVQRLAPHLFKAWVNLLCLANMGDGKLPSIDDIAFRLRLSVQDAGQQVADLILAGLLDITNLGTEPHNWSKRQFVSDCSTERVRKHRKNNTETECNVSETATETAPDTETEQIQNRTDSDICAPKREKRPSASAMLDDPNEPARFENGRLVLTADFRSDWLGRFGGDDERLSLALVQAQGYLQPNNHTKTLGVQISAQLARIVAEKRDRDKRYASAAKASQPAAQQATSNARAVLNRMMQVAPA
jgi:hypothetical protein